MNVFHCSLTCVRMLSPVCVCVCLHIHNNPLTCGLGCDVCAGGADAVGGVCLALGAEGDGQEVVQAVRVRLALGQAGQAAARRL